MGAHTFFTRYSGDSVDEAFSDAVSRAKHMHGHGGYSGTIAEKSSVVEIPQSEIDADTDPQEHAMELIDDCDDRIDSKWGPAGAIEIEQNDDGTKTYLFFGWASS